MKQALAFIISFAASALTFGHLPACSSTPTLSTEQKAVAAEGTYGAQLQMCVQNNTTTTEIDACADTVRARWSHLDGGAK